MSADGATEARLAVPADLVTFHGAKVVVPAWEEGGLTYGMSRSPGTRRIHCVAGGLK